MSESSLTQAERRFSRPNVSARSAIVIAEKADHGFQLRTATMILPKTGERVKKAFTLRRPRTHSRGSGEFLLAPGTVDPRRHRDVGTFEKFTEGCKDKVRGAYAYAISPIGINILKCSLAYILASLATFVPAISGLLGRNDGKHIVATISVYFHPARSAGSMAEAILLAFAAFIYAATVSFTSMGVSVFFANQHLLALGHLIVLIIFCGMGLGLVGWTKQKLGNPLVNTAASLTSLVLITVLTKEGAVQAAKFSYNKVWQVLKMLIMGTAASSAVALLIRPTSARTEFRDTFIKATDAMGEMLTIITRSFLSGSEQDLKDAQYMKASNQSNATFKTLVKNLGEARYEHYILGTEEEFKIESRLVKCLEQLTQSIGGLRSAAETQFTLLAQAAQTEATQNGFGADDPINSTIFSDNSPASIQSPSISYADRRSSLLASIDELPENSTDVSEDEGGLVASRFRNLPIDVKSSLTAPDMFSIFIAHLGPPMVSCVI
jgi:gas vesicle protein